MIFKKVIRDVAATAHLLLAVIQDLREGGLRLRAAGLTYTTLLSLAPLLAVSFSVLKGFGVHNQLEPFLLNFLAPLGEGARELAGRITNFVDNIEVGVLGAVGISILIYGVISLMREIENAFNEIWQVRKMRSLPQRIRDYLGVLFIGPFFLFLSVAMTSAFRYENFTERFFGLHIPGGMFETITVAVPYILFVLAFTVLYMFMPNTQVRAFPALVGGVVTGVLWKMMGWLFGFFVVGSASYAVVYSAFAALMLFIIWIYLGWLTVLAGASIAYYLQNPASRRMRHRFRPLSPRVREKIALLLCSEVSRSFYAGEESPALPRLAERIKVPVVIVSDVAEALASAGILAVTGKTQPRYIPGCPFEAVSVDDMLKKLRSVDEATGIGPDQVKSTEIIDHILEIADKMSERELGKITLKQIAGSLKA